MLPEKIVAHFEVKISLPDCDRNGNCQCVAGGLKQDERVVQYAVMENEQTLLLVPAHQMIRSEIEQRFF